jgi:hypothetical protein
VHRRLAALLAGRAPTAAPDRSGAALFGKHQ